MADHIAPTATPCLYRRVIALVALVLAALLLISCIPADPAAPATQPAGGAGNPAGETATVTRIIDGDTIDVRLNGETQRVRYIGVNTPERDEPCYNEATAANSALVRDRAVTLVRDVSETDQYGRLLRYVYVGDVFVNAELVMEGYAESRHYPPDTAYTSYFDRLEATARSANLGCHPTGVFQ